MSSAVRCTYVIKLTHVKGQNGISLFGTETCDEFAVQFIEMSWPKHKFKALCEKHSERRSYQFFKKITENEYIVGRVMTS
jgi:hypothetical protein